jgi:uncharacterized protein (TIGR02588 family)
VTFGISCVVLAVIIGLLALNAGGDDPAAPEAAVVGTRAVAGEFEVAVDVRNTGDAGAADVQVVAELTSGDTVTEADLVVDFLAGGEQDSLVFLFPADPADGELEVRVAGFREP